MKRTLGRWVGGLWALGLLAFPVSLLSAEPVQEKAEAPRYSDAQAIFAKNCAGCHNAKEKKGEFNLETYEALKKGGDSGPAIVPGKPGESPLLAQVERRAKPFMPPPQKGKRLTPAEISLIRAWIVAGAPGPRPGELPAKTAALPHIVPRVAPRRAIQCSGYEPKAKVFALARLGDIELRSAESWEVLRTLAGAAGPVNAIAFSPDGSTLAAAGGEPGVSGELRLWNVSDGRLLKVWKGHEDSIYSLAVSPDGKTFATGSYDHAILLWDRNADQPTRAFHGHNEAVMGLAFRPDGKVLASASADRTVKLWDVATGERRDTLGEATKALNAVVFSPDGSRVAAGGVDNRIRIWSVSPDAKEGTNPLRISAFAHEGAILKLAWSPDGKTLLSSADDRTVKLWNAADVSPKAVLERQSDWPTALSFGRDAKEFLVGRLDGSFQIYSVATGAVAQPPKPELSALEPRGIERGVPSTLRLVGKRLSGELKCSDPAVQIRPGERDQVEITVPAAHAPGEIEFWLAGPQGESARVKLEVDTLPQKSGAAGGVTPAVLPVSLWGALQARGQVDTYSFEGAAGQKLVVDAAARRLGSKAELTLRLTDAQGRLIASSIDFEGESDPLIFTTLPAAGRYLLSVADLELGASPEHVYRVSLGDFPVVTGAFPLALPAKAETAVRYVGVNLPPGAGTKVNAGAWGEATVPVDAQAFRARRELKLLVSTFPEVRESEDNDRPEHAVRMSVPGAAEGTIDPPGDSDLYRFEARQGQVRVIETQAAQRGSPIDTRIEVLHADGQPVERVLLRAVRDSYITFRPIDSVQGGGRFWHWEEMDLSQYLYLQGEVVKLFLAPQGPDSEWKFFTQAGKRRNYFGTSATAHPLDSPAYIVEPHPPGTKLPPNGLPVFPVYYANDDDPDRKLGSDSKLLFTAPADGAYLVRVRDARGAGGPRYVYRLIVRPAEPDFRVTLEGLTPTVPLGSGTSFTVRVDRIDGYEGPIRVDLSGLPEGFSVSTPILIEEGHVEAKGTLYASMDCTAPGPKEAGRSRVIATGWPGGREVRHDAGNLGTLALAPRPRTVVWLEPDLGTSGDTAAVDPHRPKAVGSDRGGRRITLKPGGRVSALLRVQRFGHNDRVTFDVDNLPFGAIVDDIGLNGILIPEGATERRIFLNCSAWTPAATRPCFARVRESPNPTSPPILVEVPSR